MMHGSLREDGKAPADFEYYVRVSREVVDMAHPRGVSLEAELGTIGGIEDGQGRPACPESRLGNRAASRGPLIAQGRPPQQC